MSLDLSPIVALDRPMSEAPTDGTPIIVFTWECDAPIIVAREDGDWLSAFDRETKFDEASMECWWPLPELPERIKKVITSHAPDV